MLDTEIAAVTRPEVIAEIARLLRSAEDSHDRSGPVLGIVDRWLRLLETGV